MNQFLYHRPVPLSEIKVNEENILRVLQVPVEKADDYLKDLIHDLIEYSREIASPLASCSIFSGDEIFIEKDRIIVGSENFQVNKMVASALHKSTAVAFFIGCCGDKPEQYSRKMLAEGNSLEGYIVDIIGSEMAECIAEFIQESIETYAASKGLKITNRFSPGYCKWPVDEQQKLFGVMDTNTAGVSLTASSLMLPVKSVSGLIGIGPDVKNLGYACNICEMDQCLYRDLKR